jgi:hypothetical protein
MGGTRAAVAAAIVSAEKDGSGESGAFTKIADAGFAIDGTPYAAFVTRYFRERPAGAGATTPGEVGEPSSPA